MAYKSGIQSTIDEALGKKPGATKKTITNPAPRRISHSSDINSVISEALGYRGKPKPVEPISQPVSPQQPPRRSLITKIGDYLNPRPDEVRQGVLANLGPEIIKKTPILGSVVDSINNSGYEDLQQFNQTTKKDLLKFTGQSLGAMVVGPFARMGAQVTGKKEINIKPLGDAGHFESYSQSVDRDIRAGVHPALAVLKQTPNVILDVLFAYGTAKSVLSPRESVVGPSGKPTSSNIIGGTPKPKSFRSYEPPKPQYIPIDPKHPQGANVLDALSPYTKFKEGKPTFLKVEATPSGSLRAKFVQILPSRVKGMFLPGESGGRPIRLVPETVLDNKLILPNEAMGLIPKTGANIGLPKTLPPSPIPAIVPPTVTPGEFPLSSSQIPNYKPPVQKVETPFPVSKTELKPEVATKQGSYATEFPTTRAEVAAKPGDNIIIYRGGSALDTTKGSESGISFTTDKKFASDIAANRQSDNITGARVVETRTLSPGAKIATAKDVPPELLVKGAPSFDGGKNVAIHDFNEPAIVQWAKANGFDAIDFRTLPGKNAQLESEIRVLNPDVIQPIKAEPVQKIPKSDGSNEGDWKLSRDEYLDKYPEALNKQPWEMSWIEQEKIYVQGLLSKSKEFAAANKAFEATEFGTPASRKAGRLVEKIDHEADVEITQLVKESKNSPEALAKLNKYRSEIKQKSNTKLSGTALASKNGRKLGTAEQMPVNKPDTISAKPGTPQFKIFEKVEGLIRKYAKTIGEGYLPRNARGVYYHNTQNIFVDGMNNVSTAAHEITHFLDHKYNIIKDLISMTPRGALPRKQLTDLYVNYYSGGSKNHKLELRMREGYATLLQQYAIMPETITAQYPTLVKEFLQPGGRYYKPVIGEVIQDLHTLVSDYQGLSSLDKVGATVVTEDFKTNKPSFLSKWEKIRTIMADDIYGFEVLDTKAGVNRSKESVSLLTRGVRNHTSAVFQSNLSGKNGLWTLGPEGEMVKVSDNNIGNLMQRLSEKRITDEFAFYLVARDGYFAWKNLTKLGEQALAGGSTPEATAQLKQEYKEAKAALEKEALTRDEVTQAYRENKDRFVEEEKMYDELTRKGELDILHDALLLDDVKYSELTTKEGYASKKRVFYNELLGDTTVGTGSLGVGKTRVSSLIKRKGSSRAIQNPLYSLIKDHHEIMNKAGRQHIYNRILNIAPKFDELFQIQTLKTSPDGQSPMERDPHYIMARKKVDGPGGSKIKKVPILTDNLVKQMLDNVLNYEDIHIIEKVLRTASTIKVVGTTASYPAFGAVNVIRDQLTAPVFSVNKYKPVYTAIHEFLKSLDPNKPEHVFMKEFFVLGGDHYTLVSFDSQTPAQALKSVAREAGGIKKYTILVASGGLKTLQAPAKYSEVITRASEYIKSRMDGNDQWTAMEDAQRVSGPFAHIGALQPLSRPKMTAGQTAVKSIPFANAGLQIFDQTLRTVATEKGRQRFAFMAGILAVAFGGALLYTKKKATESQKSELKGYDPSYLTQYIFIPKQSGEGFIRIPVPQNMATFGGMINMVILDKWLGADYKASEYIDAATTALPQQLNPTNLKQFLFSYFPQLISGAVQTAFWMRTFPKPIPIESQRMQTLPEQYRFNDKTSPVAKFIGEKLHLSPIKIDFATTTWLGRTTGLLLGNKKAWNPLSGFEQGYYWESSRQMDKYWAIKTKMTQDQNAFKKGFSDDVNLENKGLIKAIDNQMTIYNRVVQAGDTNAAKAIQKQIEQLVSQLK